MPSGVELATGYVSLVVDTRRIPPQLAAAFGTAADRAERDFGQAFGDAAQRGGRELSAAFGRAADGAGRELSDALGRAGEQAGGQGGEAAAGGIADVLGTKAGVFGAVLGSAFAVAGVSVGGLFVKALQRGMEREQALDLTQARLGVDEETMQRIGAAAGRAYVGAFGESVEENVDVARQAFQSGLIDGDATAAEIQKVIQQIQGVTELVGGDLTETTKAASIMLKAGLAENASEAFDAITAGYRAAGPAGDDLIDSIKEYSSGWKNTGLNASQAMALIGQSIELGADSTDRAADALREFGRRVYEEEESIVEALDEIGLNGKEMYDRFAEGGQTAFDAFDEAFDKIRLIKDPVERNTAAMALLGDTAGDFIGTFTRWDPSAAVEKFGQVQGAADAALATMGGNSASTIESAKRSIEVSADAISSALARAFGPELDKVANWITTHQPEILGFLGDAADFALVGADAFLVFASNSLRAFGMFAEGARSSLSSIMDPLGLVAELFGKLTGSGDLEDLGNAMQDLDDQLQGAADGAFDLADAIDNKARPKLLDLRNSVADNVDQAVAAQEMFRALGDQVVAVPDGKTVTVTDNSPEAQARFAALGIRIEQIPGSKEFRLVANTAEGQARIDTFVAQNSNRQITMQMTADWSRVDAGIRDRQVRENALPYTPESGYVHYAAGGIAMAGSAKIARSVVNQYAEEGPEAYIPLSPERRSASIPIWLEAGRHLGMVREFADGGIASQRAVDWARSQNGKPYIYGPQDCSWYQSEIYNRLTGKSVRFTTASDLTAFGFKPGSDPNGFTVGTNGGVGTNGHMTGRLLGTAVESDGSNGVQFGGSADGPESMPKQYYLPRDLWAPPETDNPAAGRGALGGAPSGAGSPGGAGGPGSAGSPGVAGAPGGLGGNASGGTFGGQDVPAGVVPVWIIGPSGNVAPAPTDSGSATPQATPAESFAPQETKPADMPDVGARMAKASGDFLSANFDQFLGDLGLRSSGGALQALTSAIVDYVAEAAAAEVRKAQAQTGSAAAPFMGRR
ncbi:phage tail tape measure protein [Nocardia gipuzkoensis]